MKILDTSLEKGLSICACYYLAAYSIVGAMRLQFPGALEWLESNAYYHVVRILAGQSLYVEPSLKYVPSIYPPLYFYVAALLARITGPGFLALRLVSYLSSLGSMALIGYIVYRESSRRAAGLWAAGFFAATYCVTATYFDAARVDPLFLFLTLCAVTAVRFMPGMSGCILAGGLLAGAALTKQTALILCLPLFLYAYVFRPRQQALCFIGFFIITLGLVSLWLNAATQGWYFFYAFALPATAPDTLEQVGRILAPADSSASWHRGLHGRLLLFFNSLKKITRACAAVRTLSYNHACGLLHTMD